MTKVSIRACESYDYDVFRKSFEKRGKQGSYKAKLSYKKES